MQDPSVPISDKEYDFRTEPVAQMDAAAVDMHLANIMAGNPSHPYLNPRDRRHEAATSFVTALHERRIALRPQRDEGAELITQMNAEKKSQLDTVIRQCQQAGFGGDFDIPADLPAPFVDAQISLLKRDLLLHKGEIHKALPELLKDISALGIKKTPGLQHSLNLLEVAGAMSRNVVHPATMETELDLDPSFRDIAISAAFAVQRAIAEKHTERYKAFKTRRDSQSQGGR